MGLTDEQVHRISKELPVLYPRLLDAAVRMSLRRRWAKRGHMAAGNEPDDMVQRAAEALLTGERDWPTGTSLFHPLFWSMRSMVGHLSRSGANLEGYAPKRDKDGPPEVEERDPELTPEERILDGERCQELYEQLMAEVGHDPLLGKIIEAGLRDAYDAAAIAEESGVTIKQVYRGVERVRRRAAEIVKGWRPKS